MKTENGNNSTYNMDNIERDLALVGGSVCLLFALRERSWKGLLLGTVGTSMLVRGLTGESVLAKVGIDADPVGLLPERLQPAPLEVYETLTVNCTPEEAYQFWRNLENLPRFMTHLQSVEVQANGRSHWVVKTPPGLTLTWDAEMVADSPNELIHWQTVSDTAVQHTGIVTFKQAPPGRGTELTTHLRYEPPGGLVGEAFAHLTNTLTAQLIREELRRFKAVLETGEVPTIEGQPSGRK